MPLTYEIDNSDYGRQEAIGAVSLPWADTLESTMQDAWVHNPTQALGDVTDYYLAQHPEWRGPAEAAAGFAADLPLIGPAFAGPAASARQIQQTPPKADEFVDAHTLNQQYGQSLGLSFDKPMRRGAVDILVKQKQDQLQRDYTLAHGPSGVLPAAGNFVTSLAVSAADPLNVAATFVPVVPEARAAMWAERYGPTVSRVLTGSAEGAAGTAAIQPIESTRDLAFDQEYGPMDAFMNVAFGSVLGGGLHAALGKIGDAFRPETKDAALRSAIGQSADGRAVDVEPVLASDSSFSASERPARPDATETAAPVDVAARTPEPATREETAILASAARELSPEAQERLQSYGIKAEELDLGRGETPPEGVPAAGGEQGLEPERLGGGETVSRPPEGAAGLSTVADDALARARENAANPPPSRATSPDASLAADRNIATKSGDDIEAEHEAALAQLAEYEKQGIVTPEQAAEARSNDGIQKAQRDGAAAKAASRCLLLHP